MAKKCRILKKKIPKATLRKYGWKPTYYEVKCGKSVIAIANTKKEAIKWKKRYEK